jgi:hypothetical protein
VTTNAADGYHLVITPSGTSTSLAGRYQITNLNSGLALDTAGEATAQETLADQASGQVLGINAMSTAAGRPLQDRELQQRSAPRGLEHEHRGRSPSPAVGRQRHRRPPVDPHRPLIP